MQPIEKAREVAALLNEMLLCDREATIALLQTRVPCGSALAEHPRIAVATEPGGVYSVGALGLLNGLLAPDAWVRAVCDWGPDSSLLLDGLRYFDAMESRR